jgi:predicted Zn-dependent protease
MKFSFRRSLRLGALSLLLLPLGSATRPQQGPKPDPQVLAQFGLYENATLQSLIDTKGQQMNKVSDRPGNYGFTVVDSPIINAFATPDGHVYFTRGIMAYFNNEAQFAGVLGHELGHITAQHGQKQQRRSTAANIGLLLGSLASKRIASIAEPLSQGVGVLFLKYGRDDERQADQLGVKYSTKIGYDAAQMADFFLTLQRTEAQSGAGGVPTFLSSHPNSADRYKTVKTLAAQTKASLGNVKLNVNRDSYLRSIEGLAYGDDPRQGFVESSVFYHPELKFRLPIPAGWKSQNSPTQFQMAEPNGKALIVFMATSGASLEAAAQALSKSIGIASAQAQKTTINGFPAIVFQGDQAAQSGSTTSSARVLAHVIQDGSNYYGIIGLTAPASFATYSPQFSTVAQGFQRLTDASKLNRQPERVRIKTAASAQTLAQALSANGIAATRHEELAILNGMQKTDRLSAGQLYKVVGR